MSPTHSPAGHRERLEIGIDLRDQFRPMTLRLSPDVSHRFTVAEIRLTN